MKQSLEPLTTDVRAKNLVYVSTAKLEQLALDPAKRGFNVAAPLGGGGFGLPSRQLGVRDLLESAGKLLEQNGIMTYEIPPTIGQWLLVRVSAKCGSAWPWAGEHGDLVETAWWLGQSEKLRILAYGHRAHLVGTGKIPPSIDSESVATWWPSIDGGYRKLLKAVAKVVVSDSLEVELEPPQDAKATFRGLENYYFNDGVQRRDHLVRQGIFEMLLRVDGVEEGNDDEAHIVFGSPLWVARETRAVPGTYLVQDYPEESGVVAVASWDGLAWSDLRVKDGRNTILGYRESNVALPPIPTEPPDVGDIISLDIRPIPPSAVTKAEAVAVPPQNGLLTWFQRKWKGE
ncbi:hypothetical protein GCM10009596_19050 [Arthrobacter rhombi]|uniref:hypothetical protein n=1 Tax=Arthrobacter rhombi TaxID=71253 RepID=UPI0031E106DD